MSSAASNIVITNLIQFFFILSVDGISFSEEHCIWCNNTELFRLSCYDFKFNGLEIASDNKKISFLDWSVSIFEVRNKVGFSQITCKSLNCIFNGKNVNLGKIWDFTGWSNLDNVTESDSEIFSDSLIHSDFSFVEFIID